MEKVCLDKLLLVITDGARRADASDFSSDPERCDKLMHKSAKQLETHAVRRKDKTYYLM